MTACRRNLCYVQFLWANGQEQCAEPTEVFWNSTTSSFASSMASKPSGRAELKYADKYSVLELLVPKHTE